MSEQTQIRRVVEDKALWRLAMLLAASLGVALLALSAASGQGISAAIGIGVLVFLAAAAVGGFLGFLFGVPRVLAQDDKKASGIAKDPAATAEAATEGKTAKVRLLSSNTNLERISDWLTTLLVGAGLVELHNVDDALFRFREFLEAVARPFPGPDGTMTAGAMPAIGPIILIFGTASGFLFMYLNTRLVLVRLFHAIEIEISREEILPPSGQRTFRAFARQSEPTGRSAKKAASGEKATVDDALNLMFDLLYQSDPDRVLALSAELSNTDAVNRPDYWFYTAAALGQRLHQLQPGSEEYRSTRDNALDAARRAVALDPSYKSRLWVISDPTGTDNDLARLRDDREFLDLVGR